MSEELGMTKNVVGGKGKKGKLGKWSGV